MNRFLLLAIFVVLSCMSKVFGQSFDYSAMLNHPRILLPAGGERRILESLESNPIMQKIHAGILAESDRMIATAPVQRIKEGKRLLAVSRKALERIFYLAYSYRMTGDERYAERARKELLAASAFTDWNPAHFLDVGEMTMAMAIGYDWLFDYLSPEDKKTISDAINEKGFKAADNPKHAWFYERKNNWNQVCNAGLVFGALATYENNPQESRRIIEKAVATNRQALESYAPDGGYPEGFMYWGYGTAFQILMSAALESALGSDAGMSAAPGFLESARFIQYMTAPGGECFSFSDTPQSVRCNMMMYWCAGKLKDTSLLWLEKKYIENMPEDFAENPGTWFAEYRLLPSLMIFGSDPEFAEVKMPDGRFWVSGGITPVFIYRGGWDSPDDTYLGIKGGSASAPHAHMDAGSFVYEKEGVRWSMDLGMQSYITLESRGVDLWNGAQDGQRWDVFRLCNLAHSTLTMNGQRHRVDGYAPITEVFRSNGRKGASVDLTTTFGDLTKQTVRTLTLDREDNLTVVDKICNGPDSLDVCWIMTTPATAEITGDNSIRLSKDGKKMLLSVESEQDVEMFIWDNIPPHDYDFRNPGTCRVGFRCTIAPGRQESLKVRLKSL